MITKVSSNIFYSMSWFYLGLLLKMHFFFYAITILLAFYVNGLVVADYTPEASSEIPIIGVYYTFNTIFVALLLAGSIFILNIVFFFKQTVLFELKSDIISDGILLSILVILEISLKYIDQTCSNYFLIEKEIN